MNSIFSQLKNWKSRKFFLAAYLLLTAILLLWYNGENSRLDAEGELIRRDLPTSGFQHSPDQLKKRLEQERRVRVIEMAKLDKQKQALRIYLWFIPFVPVAILGSMLLLLSGRHSFKRIALVISMILLVCGLIAGAILKFR